MKQKGHTVTYFGWEDGKPRVAGRFKTEKEKNDFLDKIYRDGSSWTEEELSTIGIVNDYNYMLPY